MPVKIVHPNHSEIIGSGKVLLTSPHLATSDADLHTGPIVEEAALTSKSYAVIGRVKGEFLDPAQIQSARLEVRKRIDGFIEEDGVRFHVNICGKKEPGVGIFKVAGEVCSDSTLDLVKSRLANDFQIVIGVKSEVGDELDRESEEGRKTMAVESIRIEFGPDERQFQKEKVIRDVSEIADLLNAYVTPSPTN